MNNSTLAYAAALIDGEGSVSYDKTNSKKLHRHPIVSITSTSYELLVFMKENFGGSICSHKTYQTHHKPHWSWRVKYDSALSLLEAVRPYMLEKEKCRRADLLIARHKLVTPRNGQYTPELFQARQDLEDDFFSKSGAVGNRTRVL